MVYVENSIGAILKRFNNGDGGRVKKGKNLSTIEILTWGKGVSKILEKLILWNCLTLQ